VRARETQRPDGFFKDEKAVEIVNRLEADFSKINMVMHRHDEIAVIVRMKRFDRYVREFLERNPEGVVVHFGCGLDTRFERVDNGSAEWFDLDLSEVTDLRKKLISAESPRYHLLTTSVFQPGWIPEVSRLLPRPFLFMGEGVLPYFEEAQIRELFLRLRDHFPGCEMVCDAHTPFVIWADNLHLALAKIKARMKWKLKSPRDVERWGADIWLIEEWFYYADDEPLMESFRWLRLLPGLMKSSGIHHFRLGK
jgi:O-methyltransferase involved in polyketide biosynthesis